MGWASFTSAAVRPHEEKEAAAAAVGRASMGSLSSRVWGPRAGAAEGAEAAGGRRSDGTLPKRKRGEGLSESGEESDGEERLLSTPRRYGRKGPDRSGGAPWPPGEGGVPVGRGRPRWGGGR